MNLTTDKNTPHTPGPWTIDDGMISLEDQCRILLNNTGTDSEWVCVGINDHEGMEAVVALCHPTNAPLIAAAPDLLVALEQCVPLIVAHANYSGEGVPTLQVARLAIAQAKEKTT